eukprot:scaffold358_cov109-Cylindrotheca_fusiformis.AAC.4
MLLQRKYNKLPVQHQGEMVVASLRRSIASSGVFVNRREEDSGRSRRNARGRYDDSFEESVDFVSAELRLTRANKKVHETPSSSSEQQASTVADLGSEDHATAGLHGKDGTIPESDQAERIATKPRRSMAALLGDATRCSGDFERRPTARGPLDDSLEENADFASAELRIKMGEKSVENYDDKLHGTAPISLEKRPSSTEFGSEDHAAAVYSA